MFEYAEYYEKKRPTEVGFKVAYTEGNISGLLVSDTPKKEAIQDLDISAEELDQAILDSLAVYSEKQKQNIPLFYINHGWTKLSRGINPKYVIFFTRYNHRLIEAITYRTNDIGYEEQYVSFMGSALIYRFYFDKTTRKIIKVRVGETHA